MKLTISQALQKGIAAHGEGKLQDAERFYRAILQVQPEHPDANHNLGVIAVAVGKIEAAFSLFSKALEANPDVEQFWLSYIDILIRKKQFRAGTQALVDAKQAGNASLALDALEERLLSEAHDIGDDTSNKFNEDYHTDEDDLSPAMESLAIGDYKGSQQWLNNVIEHGSPNAEALSLLSQVLLLDDKEVEAQRALSRAISINSELPSIHRNQARLFLKQSRHSNALEMAELAWRKAPGNIESQLVLAVCLAANTQESEALQMIEKILTINPDYAEAFANRSILKLRQGDTAGAIEDLVRTVSLKPHLTQMWSLLSSLYYQAKDLAAAIKALKHAVKNDPANTDRLVELGELLRQDNKADEAVTMLEHATELDPKSSAAWTSLGVAFQQQGRISDARLAYETALSLNPQSAVIASNLGVLANKNRDWDSALRYFEKALGVDPNLAEVHCNLGASLKEMGRLDEAITSYQQTIILDPSFAEAHEHLGGIFFGLDRLEEAATSTEYLVKLKPEYAEAHSNLGIILKALGRLTEAEASYRQAITLKPSSAEACSNLGTVLRELGRLDEASTWHARAIELKPNFIEAHYQLAATLQELGKLHEAEASLRQTITLKPDFAEAHHNLGLTLQEKGEMSLAEASQRKAIALKPGFAEAHSKLGILLSGLKRFDEAEVSFRQAITLREGLTEAHQHLLKCLYLQNKKSSFFDQLTYLARKGEPDAVIGAMASSSALKFDTEVANPFCNDPLNYVQHVDIAVQYDFEKVFVKQALSLLKQNKLALKSQDLLVDGIQTAGNLFKLEDELIGEMERIIRVEIEKYRSHFRDSSEGLFTKWPPAYSLTGWLVSMKSGGRLKPHIHDKGWISGSVYISVPSKNVPDSGNLNVTIGDHGGVASAFPAEVNTIDVKTGSLVLFPSSITHYTTPFESQDQRIVLAFDVIKK